MKLGIREIAALCKRYKLLLLAVGAGILLIALSGIRGSAEPAPEPDTAEPEAAAPEFDLDGCERELESLLSQAAGVGKVKVMLTLKSGSEEIYAMEESVSSSARESEGLTEEEYEDQSALSVVKAAEGDSPVVKKRLYPLFRGAVIVCEGGGKPSVDAAVTAAVSSLTGLTSDRITIIKMK